MADDTARDADEFLKYLREIEHEVPYSKRAFGIFLEAIAAAIAGIVAIAPDNRTPTTYLAILARELSYRNHALAEHLDLPEHKDLEALQRKFRRVVEIHGHRLVPVSERVRPEPRWPGIHHRSLRSQGGCQGVDCWEEDGREDFRCPFER